MVSIHKILTTTALCLAAGACFGCVTIVSDSSIAARLKQEEEILTPVKDHASAKKAAKLLNALEKSTSDYFLPACDPRMAKLNELSRQLEEAYYYGCPALARAMGADAVVGIDVDYEVLGEGGGMLMVTASGTAVRLR